MFQVDLDLMLSWEDDEIAATLMRNLLENEVSFRVIGKDIINASDPDFLDVKTVRLSSRDKASLLLTILGTWGGEQNLINQIQEINHE